MDEDPFELSLSSLKEIDGNKIIVKPSDIRNTSFIAVVEGINIFQDKSSLDLQLTNRSQPFTHERPLENFGIKPSHFKSKHDDAKENRREFEFISQHRPSVGISPLYRQIAAKDESRKSIYELPQNKQQHECNVSFEENQASCDINTLQSKRTVNNSVHRLTEANGTHSTYLNTNPLVKVNKYDQEQFQHSNGDQAPLESTTRNKEIREAEEFLNNIKTAQPNSVIYLPKMTLQVGTIYIEKPLKFVGNPEARLEINEAIIVDLSSYSGLEHKVLFLECNIHLKYLRNGLRSSLFLSTKRTKESEQLGSLQKKNESATISRIQNHDSILDLSCIELNKQDNQGALPLFSIAPATTIEMSDCEIRSLNFEKELGVDTPCLNDIAFLLKHSKVDKEGGAGAKLILSNCRVSDFLTAVQTTYLGSLYIEKCSFINNRGHSINLSNPESFILNECIIEKSGKSCVNIRFSKEIPTSVHRRVMIERNELIKSSSFGISIFGENMIYQACPIWIHHNVIISPLKDGIGIKNINIQQLSIFKNVISGSNGNGIFLQSINDRKSLSQIELRENKISGSCLYGLALIDAPINSDHDECSENDKGGVIVSGSEDVKTLESYRQYKISPLQCHFNHSEFKKNRDSGLIIVGCLKGNIILESCQIYENLNGIYIRLKRIDNFKSVKAGSTSKVESCSLGHILLDKTNIFQNKDSGLSLRALHEKLRFRETLIQENQHYAIFLGVEAEKQNLVLEKGKFKNLISGYVGGDWGLLDSQSDRVCKGVKCTIF